jgi:hypothetical protein
MLIAVAVDRGQLPSWVVEVVRDLTNFADVVLVEADTSLAAVGDVLMTVPGSGLARAKLRPALASQPRPPGIRCSPQAPPETDLIVDLRRGRLRNPLPSPDVPVVTVAFGARGSRSPAAAFAKPVLARRQLGSVRIVGNTRDGVHELARAFIVLDHGSMSRTTNRALWKAASLLPRALASGRLTGGAARTVGSRQLAEIAAQLVRVVTFARTVASSAKRSRAPEGWRVALQPATQGIPSTATVAAADTVWLESKTEVADPCLLATTSGAQLYVERIDERGKGSIATASIDTFGRVSDFATVLEHPTHLSYPTVVEADGRLWMLVESAERERVELYGSDAPEGPWRLTKTLLEGLRAFDPTPYYDGALWWMWASIDRFAIGQDDELCLFFSESLLGPWRAHPLNPIVDDPRCARPAGLPFTHKGQLIRPSQDGVAGYGYRIRFNEVLVMSPTVYAERSVSMIEPAWAPEISRTHTFTRAGRWQALDGVHRIGANRFVRAKRARQ